MLFGFVVLSFVLFGAGLYCAYRVVKAENARVLRVHRSSIRRALQRKGAEIAALQARVEVLDGLIKLSIKPPLGYTTPNYRDKMEQAAIQERQIVTTNGQERKLDGVQ